MGEVNPEAGRRVENAPDCSPLPIHPSQQRKHKEWINGANKSESAKALKTGFFRYTALHILLTGTELCEMQSSVWAPWGATPSPQAGLTSLQHEKQLSARSGNICDNCLWIHVWHLKHSLLDGDSRNLWVGLGRSKEGKVSPTFKEANSVKLPLWSVNRALETSNSGDNSND